MTAPITTPGTSAEQSILVGIVTGSVPILATVDGRLVPIAAVVVPAPSHFAAVLRMRLVESDRLSDALWRIVSSRPELRANSSDEAYAAALERTLEQIVAVAAPAVTSALWRNAVGLTARPTDDLIDGVLETIVSHLRFCGVCGVPFRFGRKAKRTCGRPTCVLVPRPRARPNHRAVMARVRWRAFVKEALSAFGRLRDLDACVPTNVDLVKLFEQYRGGSVAAERRLDTIADDHEAVRPVLNRLSRYRMNHHGATRTRR